MKITSLVAAAFVVAVGGSGAVVAYVSASPAEPAPHAPAVAPAVYAARPAPLRPRPVRFRPCAAGTRLEHGVCVRHVVRTVVVPAAPTTSGMTASSTPAGTGAGRETAPGRAVHRPRAGTSESDSETREHESEPVETENEAPEPAEPSEPPETGDDDGH